MLFALCAPGLLPPLPAVRHPPLLKILEATLRAYNNKAVATKLPSGRTPPETRPGGSPKTAELDDSRCDPVIAQQRQARDRPVARYDVGPSSNGCQESQRIEAILTGDPFEPRMH